MPGHYRRRGQRAGLPRERARRNGNRHAARTARARAMNAIASEYEVAVVGAGPAGLAAPSLCARAGLATVLLDDQPSPGGQVYRGITTTPVKNAAILGADYSQGMKLVDEFFASGAQYVPGAGVWSLTPALELGVSVAGAAALTEAASVILATGAIERPFPIANWTLPGVMTAGAAQALLQTSGLVPEGPLVLAGTGPLLWLAAWQYVNAGVKIDAILDTTPHENRSRALRHLPGFLVSTYLRPAMRVLTAVRGRVPIVPGVTELRADGGQRVESVTYRTADGLGRRLPVDTLLLHQGVAPNVNLAMSAAARHRAGRRPPCLWPLGRRRRRP